MSADYEQYCKEHSRQEVRFLCTACGGEGFQGIEEDSGKPYTCYRCYETGWETFDQTYLYEQPEEAA